MKLSLHPRVRAYHRLFARAEDSLPMVMFTGAAGLCVRTGVETILLDPYFSRIEKALSWRFFMKKYSPNMNRIESGLQTAGIGKAGHILVTHTHFDHVFDVVPVMKRTGAGLCGSESAVMLANSSGEDGVIIPDSGLTFSTVHGTRVEFVPSVHMPFPRLIRHLPGAHGRIRRQILPPCRLSRFPDGQVFRIGLTFSQSDAETSVLIFGSAGWDSHFPVDRHYDTVILSVGGLEHQSVDYLTRLMEKTVFAASPKTLYLSHWDNFQLPFDRPVNWLGRVYRVIDEIVSRTTQRGIRTRILPLFQPVTLAPAKGEPSCVSYSS